MVAEETTIQIVEIIHFLNSLEQLNGGYNTIIQRDTSQLKDQTLRTLSDLEDSHKIIFFIQEDCIHFIDYLKRTTTLSFKHSSFMDELQIIFTINKILGITEYHYKNHLIRDETHNTDWNYIAKLFLKREVTFNTPTLHCPPINLKKCLQIWGFPCLKLLDLSKLVIYSMQYVNCIDAQNLQELKITNCNLKSINGLNKAIFPQLRRLTLLNCKIKDYNRLSRTKLTRGNNTGLKLLKQKEMKKMDYIQEHYHEYSEDQGLLEQYDMRFIFKLESPLSKTLVNAFRYFCMYGLMIQVEKQHFRKQLSQGMLESQLKSIMKKVFPNMYVNYCKGFELIPDITQ